MSRILVTGLPGTGKSSVLAELGRRGFRIVDTDDPGWHEYHRYADPIDELHRGEYHWIVDKMTELLDSDHDRLLIVGGIARNQSTWYDRFDAVVLLRAPVRVMLDRVVHRTANDYGKTELDRAEIVADVAEIEPFLIQACSHELDTNRPLDEVVADVIAIASDADCPGERR